MHVMAAAADNDLSMYILYSYINVYITASPLLNLVDVSHRGLEKRTSIQTGQIWLENTSLYSCLENF